jgi:hypothetical protein
MIALIILAILGPSLGFVTACLLGARRAAQLEEERDDARYERDVNEALLVASQASQRLPREQAMAWHPAGGRSRLIAFPAQQIWSDQ